MAIFTFSPPSGLIFNFFLAKNLTANPLLAISFFCQVNASETSEKVEAIYLK